MIPARGVALQLSGTETLMKLNLGCGTDHLGGWINVDRFPACRPDMVHDLEQAPWPFADASAEEILFKHSLEHMGRDTRGFQAIVQELYRVCAPGAMVRIIAYDPRHQDFLEDPGHVRPVVPGMFRHFSLAVNEGWIRQGHLPGTPLAIHLGVDFQLVSAVPSLDPHWEEQVRTGRVSPEDLARAMRDQINVVRSHEITLRALKPFVRYRTGTAPAAG